MSAGPTRRTAWTQQQLSDALREAVCADTSSPPANAWTVEVRGRDLRGAEPLVSSWLPSLEAEALSIVTREARSMPGMVTVEVCPVPHLHRGQVHVRGQARSGAPAPPPLDRGVPGTPRLELPCGGTAASGSMAADGLVREIALPAGRSVLGSAPEADVRLDAAAVVARHAELIVAPEGSSITLRDLGTGVGTLVDGVRRESASLHDGSRLQLGEAVLVLRVDPVQTAGRQGGGPSAGEDPEPSTGRSSGTPVGPGAAVAGARRTPTPLWVAVLLVVLGACLVGLAVALLGSNGVGAVACGLAGLVLGAAGLLQAWRHRMFEDVS